MKPVRDGSLRWLLKTSEEYKTNWALEICNNNELRLVPSSTINVGRSLNKKIFGEATDNSQADKMPTRRKWSLYFNSWKTTCEIAKSRMQVSYY